MKKNYIKILGSGLFFLVAFTTSWAQSRSLAFLEINPDVRTAAMGNVLAAHSYSNALYTNPASILFTDQKYTVDFSTDIYPSVEGIGRETFYQLNAGWHFLPRHAVHAGFRYIGGQSIQRVNSNGDISKRSISPFDWAVDLAYTFRISRRLSLYGQGSFIQSYVFNTAYTPSFGFGVSYRQLFENMLHPAAVAVHLKVSDLGPAIAYDTKSSYALPSALHLGLDFRKELASEHDLVLALGSKYFFLPSTATQLFLGGGAEYVFRKLFALRAGYEWGWKDLSHATIGGGLQYHGFRLDFAYKHATSKWGVSSLMLGLGWSL